MRLIKKKKKRKEKRTEAIVACTFCVLHKFCFCLIFGCEIRKKTEIKCLSKSVSKEQNRIQGTTDLDKQWSQCGDWF